MSLVRDNGHMALVVCDNCGGQGRQAPGVTCVPCGSTGMAEPGAAASYRAALLAAAAQGAVQRARELGRAGVNSDVEQAAAFYLQVKHLADVTMEHAGRAESALAAFRAEAAAERQARGEFAERVAALFGEATGASH